MTDKTYTLTQAQFDLAFQETMMHFQRTGAVDKETLDKVCPALLGHFEGALQDAYPTEHLIEKWEAGATEH